MIRTFLRLIGQSLRDMTLTPWAQVLTISAVTMVAFLVGLFLMVITSLDKQVSTVKGETMFQVYWQPGVNEKSIQDQWRTLESEMSGLYSITTYTSEQALQEMAKKLDKNADAKNFVFLRENNPLPATALLTIIPTNNSDQEQWAKSTSKYLQDLPGVKSVTYDSLDQRLSEVWNSVKMGAIEPAIIFLFILMGLVIGNTIRLAFLAKAREVEILKLVGAFNWYIRMPLLVGGALQGIIGSGLALVLLRGLFLQLKNQFTNIDGKGISLSVEFLSNQNIALMLLVPALMGIIGGWIGLKKYKGA